MRRRRTRRRRAALALVALLALPWATPQKVAAQDAAEIVQRADRARRPAETFVWNVAIQTEEGGEAPQRYTLEVYVKGAARTFMRFLAPARYVGRSLLNIDRDLWIYLPDAGKPVRIPLSQRLTGQVANGDIARIDYAGDYVAVLTGSASVDGTECHVLDLKARTKDVTYEAIRYWVSKELFRPVRAEFYAGTGTLLKTGTFGEWKRLGGQTIATQLTLVDAIRKDRRSVLEFSDLKVRDLPDKYFTRAYMKLLD